MRMKIRFLMLVPAILVCNVLYAQNKKAPARKTPAAGRQEAAPQKKKDNLNKKDATNRKQGLWFYEYEARMGEPHYYEYGSYQDDRKTGVWTKLDNEQRLMATETYSRGVLNGIAHYYEEGRLICVGTYRGIYSPNKYDSVWITNVNTYEDTLVAVPTEIGHTKHGLWRYYDAKTGQLTREEEYQVDYLISSKEFHHYSREDSLRIRKRNDNLPHNRKVYAKPPAGKSRSLIY